MMKKTLKRAAVAVTAAGALGAGSLFAAAPAQAAPANLALTGSVSCKFGFTAGKPWSDGIWNMTREMTVTAHGGDFQNVHLQELGGESRFARTLKAGDSLEIKTVWRGCFPSSISGYTISDTAENLLDNFGFWWNLDRINNPRDRQEQPSIVSNVNPGAGQAAAEAALNSAAAAR